MIPLYLILSSMGLLTAGNDPKHPHTSTTRRLIPQSVHSIHNYKQPRSAALFQRKENGSEVVVNALTTQPTHYKHQRSVEQPTGSITLHQRAVANLPRQNYKNQQLSKPVDKPHEPTAGN